jgi:hypothetical protein
MATKTNSGAENMDSAQNPPSGGGLLDFWTPIIVAFAIGAGLMVASDHLLRFGETARLLVLEIGIAFVVGGVVAFTIERYMRRRKEVEDFVREQKIEKNIFLYLFRTALTSELVDEMYQMLFTRKFIRQNLEISIKLRRLNGEELKDCNDPSLLVLTQTVTYNAKNMTDQVAKHHVSPQEYTLVPHTKFLQPFTRFSVTCGNDKQELVTKEDFKGRVTNPKGGIWHYLDAPSVDVPEEQVVKVISEVQMVCRETDTKTWLTYYPAERLTLSVEVEPDLQDTLEFAVDQSHRLSLKPHDSLTTDGRKRYGWELGRPILPHQGIIIYWRRRTKSV